ncbi:hypothetical protein WEIDD23_01921 [Weissella sp. DD23]|uniref:crAss001_48 related protein n=1 Tax=Weissella sp. DD23 TaxID=1777865 RepID=UPI0007817807|nr:hypothetical protein [Weissella sp. DD23]KXU03047.1 hypothetical protein WEIDD23_01921 [Weissella sp. DD23]
MSKETAEVLTSLKKEYVELKTKIAGAEATVLIKALDDKSTELLSDQVAAMKMYAEALETRMKYIVANPE